MKVAAITVNFISVILGCLNLWIYSKNHSSFSLGSGVFGLLAGSSMLLWIASRR